MWANMLLIILFTRKKAYRRSWMHLSWIIIIRRGLSWLVISCRIPSIKGWNSILRNSGKTNQNSQQIWIWKKQRIRKRLKVVFKLKGILIIQRIRWSISHSLKNLKEFKEHLLFKIFNKICHSSQNYKIWNLN